MLRFAALLLACAVAVSAVADQKQLTSAEVANLQTDAAKVKVAELQEDQAKDRQDALADFKRGAGLGISIVMGQNDTIDDAAIVDKKIVVTRRSKDNVRAALEVHQLLTANIFTTNGRDRVRKQIEECGEDSTACPLFGVGPFAAIQVADDNAISSAGLGVMFGVRSDPHHETSFNVGEWASFGTTA
jgi:hypothetical protein